MRCSWCGSLQGVRRVDTHPVPPAARCNEVSPYDARVRCGEPRGHMSACKPAAAATSTHLCYRCWGVWRETGDRPPAYRLAAPDAGPNSGQPLELLRRGRG